VIDLKGCLNTLGVGKTFCEIMTFDRVITYFIPLKMLVTALQVTKPFHHIAYIKNSAKILKLGIFGLIFKIKSNYPRAIENIKNILNIELKETYKSSWMILLLVDVVDTFTS